MKVKKLYRQLLNCSTLISPNMTNILLLKCVCFLHCQCQQQFGCTNRNFSNNIKFDMLFSGSWDPSSYRAQLYQMQHPYVHSFPGVLDISSATSKVPDCLASGEHSSQIGTIRQLSELSQKHQQLWEAQVHSNCDHYDFWCLES